MKEQKLIMNINYIGSIKLGLLYSVSLIIILHYLKLIIMSSQFP